MPIRFKPDAPANPKIRFRPDSTRSAFSGLPGLRPEIPVNEQHPELTPGQRFDVQNLTGGDPEVAKRHLEGLGFDVVTLPGFEFAIRKKGVAEPWRKVEKSGFEWQDLTDVAGGAVTTTGQIVGGLAGAGAGAAAGLAGGPAAPVTSTGLALLKGAAGAAAGGAAAEGLLGGIGEMRGVGRTPGEFGRAVGTEAAIGAGGEILAPVLNPVVRTVIGKPLKYGAKKIGQLGGWIDKASGATGRKLVAEAAEKQAGINVATGEASGKFEAAKAARHQVVADLKSAEAEFADRVAREAADQEAAAISGAQADLAAAEGGRVIDESGARAFRMEEPIPPMGKRRGPQRIAGGGKGLPEPIEPGLPSPRQPKGLLADVDPMTAAKQEIADDAMRFDESMGDFGAGARSGAKRDRYMGQEMFNPAQDWSASRLQGAPRVVRELRRIFGPRFVTEYLNKRDRQSYLFHLFDRDPARHTAAMGEYYKFMGKEALDAVEEVTAKAAPGVTQEAARAGTEPLRQAAQKVMLGETVDPAIGKRLEDLVHARLDRQALESSPIAQAKKALIAAQGLESVARAELGQVKASAQPIRREIEKLRLEQARIRNESELPPLFREPVELLRGPWVLGKFAKEKLAKPRFQAIASKAKKAARRPIVRHVLSNVAARSVAPD